MVIRKHHFYSPRFSLRVRDGSRILGIGLDKESQSDFFLGQVPYVKFATPNGSGYRENAPFITLDFECGFVSADVSEERFLSYYGEDWFSEWYNRTPLDVSSAIVGEFVKDDLTYVVSCRSALGVIDSSNSSSNHIQTVGVEGRQNSDESFVSII